MPNFSDPSAELHKLCVLLKDHQSPDRLPQALAEFLDVEPSSSDYFMSLGSIAGRYKRLSALFETILEEPIKSLALRTVHELQGFMTSDMSRLDWPQVAAQVFTSERMNTLLMSSAFVRSIAPITVPTEEERIAALGRLDDAIEALLEYDGSISSALRDALINVRRMLDRFDIYGTDALTDELLRAFATHTVGERQTDLSTNERKARTSAWTAIAFVASIIVASDALPTAIENHYSRSQKIVQLLVGERKLLPPPEDQRSTEPDRSAIIAEPPRKKRRDKED